MALLLWDGADLALLLGWLLYTFSTVTPHQKMLWSVLPCFPRRGWWCVGVFGYAFVQV